MPKLNTRDLFIAFDMGGCPNRCKHCWLGHTPNKKMALDDIKEITEIFKNYRLDGQKYFDQTTMTTWYREPDYLDNYKELWALEKELSDKAQRFELLSIWRLARDDDYAKWAKDIGTEACQISFFGLEENTDFYGGRKGFYKDNIEATKRLIEVGITPRWQLFLTQANEDELQSFEQLIHDLKLEEKTQGKFSCFLHAPSPDGEAFHLEDIRATKDSVKKIPPYLKSKTLEHYKCESLDDVFGFEESDLLDEMLKKDQASNEYPNLVFFISPDFDVFSNIGEPLRWWSLGNIKKESINIIMDRFINDSVPGLHVNFKIPVAELASRYGRKDGKGLYEIEDLERRWIRLWGEEFGNMDF